MSNPPSVSYRHAINLKQILVRFSLEELPYRYASGQPNPGYYRHQHGGKGRACLICPKLKEGNNFEISYA